MNVLMASCVLAEDEGAHRERRRPEIHLANLECQRPQRKAPGKISGEYREDLRLLTLPARQLLAVSAGRSI